MFTRMTVYPLLAFAALLAAGCAANDPAAKADPSGENGGEAAAAAVPENPADGDDQPSAGESTGAMDLQAVNYEGLQRFIASQAGHPLVLDVWSTSCEPCVKELPNLAAVDQDFRNRGVVCATLNIDYTGAVDTTPEEAKAAARPVLEALEVFVQNLYSTVPDRELFKQELFQENGLYAPPAIFVFDGTGQVVATFSETDEGASPYEKVRAALESLLETSSPPPAG